jgi:hypothetical protein
LEYVCEETSTEVVLMKDRAARVIGFEPTLMFMTRPYRATRPFGYWTSAALACLAATLPFTPQRLLNAKQVDSLVIVLSIEFGGPIVWIVAMFWARRFANDAGRTSWWLWLTAPFALWNVLEGAIMIV